MSDMGLLSSWVKLGTSICREGSRFVISERRKTISFSLEEIVSIAGMRVNQVTYDEDFLVFKKRDGSGVVVGELCRWFGELEQEIHSLDGFPKNWRTEVERSPYRTQVVLWERLHGSFE